MKKTKRRLFVLGAGGHAKVVIEALRSARLRPAGCFNANRRLWGSTVEGVTVKGGDSMLEKISPASVVLANGIGDNAIRRKVYRKFKAKGFRFPIITAASAVCARSAVLEAGVQVLTRAVVHPGSVIGENTVINTAAIVEHDCEIGAHSFVGPGAVLCGGVTLGEGAFIGAGAVILPGIRVGRGAIIGAGAVAAKNVAAGARVRGVPARSFR